MTTRQRQDADKNGDQDAAAVVGINDGPVDVDLDEVTETWQKLRPLHVRLGGKSLHIRPPKAGLVLDIQGAIRAGEDPRSIIALMFDDQWHEVRDLIDDVEDPTQLDNLVMHYGRHFEIDQIAAEERYSSQVENRQTRRARRRGTR